MVSEPQPQVVVSGHEAAPGSLFTYVIGFLASIVLTLGTFVLVEIHVHSDHVRLSHQTVHIASAIFAILQLLVQLVFFLHLSRGSRPRWNLIVFLFMLLVVVILVGGSLWIMSNLNYHMMTPADVTNYLQSQDSL